MRLTDGEAPVAQPGSASRPELPVAKVPRSNRGEGSCLEFDPTSADNKRCGAGDFLRVISEKQPADDGGKTPRLCSAGILCSENDATATLPKLGNRVEAEVVTAGETAQRARNGFDVEGSASSIVLAGLVRHEQLANVNRERQLGTRSRPRGVNGVDAQGVRVTHLRKHTSKASGILLPVVEIMQVVEAPSPAQRLSSLKTDYARERDDAVRLADLGSIPSGSTTSTEQQVTKSAEHLGIAGRPATAADCVAGSASAQPAPQSFFWPINTERVAVATEPQAPPPRGATTHVRAA